MREDVVYSVTKEEFQNLLDNSISILQIIKYFNLSCKGTGSYRAIYKRIKNDNINMEKFNVNKKLHRKNIIKNLKDKNKIPTEEILNGNIPYNNSHSLKQRLIKENLLKNECYICGNNGIWLGKPISLDIDHINGNHTDNHLENLRILCPNCHRQTKNFGNKNRIKKEKVKKERKKKFTITKEELEKLIKTIPMTKIGKMFNVTDNTIRKRCKKLNVDTSLSPFKKSMAHSSIGRASVSDTGG